MSESAALGSAMKSLSAYSGAVDTARPPKAPSLCQAGKTVLRLTIVTVFCATRQCDIEVLRRHRFRLQDDRVGVLQSLDQQSGSAAQNVENPTDTVQHFLTSSVLR